MRLIYENSRPKFYILVDEYQWILAMVRLNRVRDGKEGYEYKKMTYYPNLCNLFEELIEKLLRDKVKKVEDLKDVMKYQESVYQLIEKVLGEVGKAS